MLIKDVIFCADKIYSSFAQIFILKLDQINFYDNMAEAAIANLKANYQGKIVAGVDEAGRGPLAGPVVAGAVIIDYDNIIPGIRDSKKLSSKIREELYEKISTNYVFGVGIALPEEIDEINILEATKNACIRAVDNLAKNPELVIVDGNMKFKDERFISLVKGDNLLISIAAASIVAKVTRDRLMMQLDREFPQYLWRKNMGYGTMEHLAAIRKYGQSPYHRRSFKIKI